MNIGKDASEYSWELVGINKENDKDKMRYPCPAEAVGKIIEEIYKVKQGEVVELNEIVNEAIRKRLKDVLDKRIISIELVYKLTKIDAGLIEKFIQGEKIESLPMKNYISLTKLAYDLSE